MLYPCGQRQKFGLRSAPRQDVIRADVQNAAQVDEVVYPYGLVSALKIRHHLHGHVHPVGKLLLRQSLLLAPPLYSSPYFQKQGVVHLSPPCAVRSAGRPRDLRELIW